jgi:hypothetical protein
MAAVTPTAATIRAINAPAYSSPSNARRKLIGILQSVTFASTPTQNGPMYRAVASGDIIAKVGITKLKVIFHVSCAMKMPGRKSATVRFEDCREGERERRFRYPTVNGHQDVTINWGGGGGWGGGWNSSRGPSPSIRLSGHRRVTRDKLDDGDSRTLLYEPTHVQF